MIPFNRPAYTGNEDQYVIRAMKSSQISGDGYFSKKCHQWFELRFGCKKALLTTSCTHALEMCALLLDIQPGDEVIMPSYTFVSTANAFVLRGARIVFVDIRPDTLNIDETKIEAAISSKTKVIVPVHYAGIACEMDVIMDIAKKYNLFVVEDAAQAMMSKYKGKYLGTIGHFGTFSFHETKNYTSAGEGGLLLVNDQDFIDRAEIFREKGTNRSKFFRGVVDKYTWVDLGSSYLMNDISAAYLWGQLEKVNTIYDNRMVSWHGYNNRLLTFSGVFNFELPIVPEWCDHNAHIYYIKVKDFVLRKKLIEYMKKKLIMVIFHYIPLHSSPAGIKFGKSVGDMKNTNKVSETLVRLPLFYNLSESNLDIVTKTLIQFFKKL